MTFRWLTAFSLLLLNVGGDGASILVYVCQTAKSHHIVFHPIIRELAVRGHHVDYYTHFPIKNPPENLNQFLFPVIEANLKEMEESMNIFEWGAKPALLNVLFARTMRFGMHNFLDCHNHNSTKELLTSNKKYDMVIGEFLFFQEDFAAFIHRFNATGVTLSSVPDSSWLNEMSGLPDNPSYMIGFFSGFSHHMNFFQRLSNFFTWSTTSLVNYYYTNWPLQQLADKEMQYDGWETRPSLMQLCSDMALYLVNSHHSMGYPYPTAPHVKQILGTNVVEKYDPLPADLQEFMDNAEHGVVYFSMGSMLGVKSLRDVNIYEPLLKVFSKLKQRVLWKWTTYSGEKFPDIQATNIKMSNWFPQIAILAHNKTKLFITHGGLGGSTETIYYGVPIIGIPVFGDQPRNVKLAATAGFGVEMHWNNLTEESLSWAINEVLDNPRYKQEALKRSAIFKDRPMKPVDEAVYWIEYVLKYGRVLQPAASHMPFYKLYLLDIFGFLLVLLLSTIYIIKKAYCCIRNKIKTKNETHTRGKLESKKRN